MKSDEIQYESQSMMIYDTKTISPGTKQVITFDFGANPENDKVKYLCDLKERELIETIVKDLGKQLSYFLQRLDIDYPNCWIITNILTKHLIEDWEHDQPGDVDLIVGNLREGRPCLDYIVGMQIKRRVVKASDELKDFPSGSGTGQSHYTSLMGFDKTLLLHFIVREPHPVPAGYAPAWNPILNSDFIRASKACIGLVKQRVEKDLFGYAWMGFGQAYGKNFDQCGGFWPEIVSEPPLRPRREDSVKKARKSLHNSLTKLLPRGADNLPIIINS